MASVSTLEMLPDELLLEVCKYLLCIDVLQSFFGLNERLTCLIKDYRDHVSFYKGSFSQSNYVYVNVLPKIGSHIRTLVIDRMYSMLQIELFYRYFSNQKLSNIFPRLEKITLIGFGYETLLPFVNLLEDFEHLVQVNIYSLFSIPLEHQSTVLDALLKANNQKIKSLTISPNWSCLRLDNIPKVPYSNIISLQIKLSTFSDLSLLFSVIPNVIQLNITLTDANAFISFNTDPPPLNHLTKFRLVSINRAWYVEELDILLRQMPNVQYLSLQLLTSDTRLIDGQRILALQQSFSHIQQFNYAVYYDGERENFDRETILTSWPPSSIELLVDETSYLFRIVAFIHTLPSYGETFISLALAGACISKTMPLKDNDSQVQLLCIDKVSSFADCLPHMARWRRANELAILFTGTNSTTVSVTGEQQQQQQHTLLFPKMVCLKELTLRSSIPSDLHHFSLILIAASNLIRLDLGFDSLLFLLDNEEVHRLLQQRIKSLLIHKVSSSYVTGFGEQHIARIASTFSRLRHMYVDLTHVFPSIDSMILCILTEFRKRLVSLCADGRASDEMKTDARKWLEDINNKSNMEIIHPTEYDAYFNVQSKRLLLWM